MAQKRAKQEGKDGSILELQSSNQPRVNGFSCPVQPGMERAPGYDEIQDVRQESAAASAMNPADSQRQDSLDYQISSKKTCVIPETVYDMRTHACEMDPSVPNPNTDRSNHSARKPQKQANQRSEHSSATVQHESVKSKAFSATSDVRQASKKEVVPQPREAGVYPPPTETERSFYIKGMKFIKLSLLGKGGSSQVCFHNECKVFSYHSVYADFIFIQPIKRDEVALLAV